MTPAEKLRTGVAVVGTAVVVTAVGVGVTALTMGAAAPAGLVLAAAAVYGTSPQEAAASDDPNDFAHPGLIDCLPEPENSPKRKGKDEKYK